MFNFCTQEYTTHRWLLDSDARAFDNDMENSYSEQQWSFDHPKIDALLFAISWRWCLLMERTVCKWRGHNIKMAGYANGDSGYEDWECTRCNCGGRHIYY